MALPSQSSSSSARRGHMYRRRRGRRGPTIVGIAIVVVGAFVVWRVFYAGMPQPAESAATPAAEPEVLASTPNVAAPKLPEPEVEQPPPARSSEQQTDQRDEASELVVRTADEPAPAASNGPLGNDGGAGSVKGDPVVDPMELRPNRRAPERIRRGNELLASNRPVEARRALTEALLTDDISRAEAAAVRTTLRQINEKLIFSPQVIPGDPFALTYVVQGGDSLDGIVKSRSVLVDWRLITRINRLPDGNLIREGQELKLITGPFHGVVDRSDYRLDMYLGDEGDRVFVCSYPVGLGEYGSTPIGLFRVRPRSKLTNPEWINPRTRERFLPDDPRNPIGEHWVGLEGIEERTENMIGYGVHGTIEPQSIGREASMGCIRLLPQDVEVVWEMLVEGVSTVEIRE